MTSLNVLLLSKLATETEVGLYNAATQLMVPLLLVYQSMAQSIFPVMCRKVEPGYQSLKRIAEHAIDLLLVPALPAAAGLFFLGDRVLSLLYKNPAFSQAFPALRIVAWVLILQGFTSVLGQVLVASHREKITLRIVVVDIFVNLLVGWPLITMFGVRGAAIPFLPTRVTDWPALRTSTRTVCWFCPTVQLTLPPPSSMPPRPCLPSEVAGSGNRSSNSVVSARSFKGYGTLPHT